MIISKYQYQPLERITYPSGARHYICPITGNKLPSVTTILDATADKSGLLEWRQRVGDKKANEERKHGVDLGSLMHQHLEKHILGEQRPGGNNHIRLMAARMADQIIHRGLVHVDEVWGSEVMLYLAQLYAGTTDVVGLYKGNPAIMDFKTAKKLRPRQMIDDYFHQLGGYGIAHDDMHHTDIHIGVIFMVSRDCEYQEFVIEGDEFREYKLRFLRRFEQFLTTQSDTK
jgi:genome maintenance exonuclease 1